MKTTVTVALVGILLLVLVTPLLAQTPDGERTGQAMGDIRERIREVDFREFDWKQFNWLMLLIVTAAVFILTLLVWYLQLVIAKILVFLVPVLAGVLAGIVIPRGTGNEQTIVTAAMIAVAGTAISLGFMLYAAIFDLKSKIRELENR